METQSPDSGILTAPDETLERVPLDSGCHIEATRALEEVLQRRIVGQDHALDTLVCSYARLLAGLHDRSRPLLTALLLGPTGVGKTETARAIAYALLGSADALIRINCEEYSQGHEISKLLGSPPGYVGQDVEPLLSQNRIEAPHREARAERATDPEAAPLLADRLFGTREDRYESIILFDEIEKAHPLLWNGLLGVLDDGVLTLGDNSSTDFTRSIILLTSNVGSRQMTEMLEGRQLGFRPSGESSGATEAQIEETARGKAEEVFPFEFLNRLDEIMVYRPLRREHLRGIFEKFLTDIQTRAIHDSDVPLLIKISEEARRWIIDRGTDLRYGARPLRRAMETHLVDPVSRLITSGQLRPGDVVEVDLTGAARSEGPDTSDPEGQEAPEPHLDFFRVSRDANVFVA